MMFREFYAYHKDSALLVDRVPIHLLPKTKRARSRLFKLLGELDWSQRADVSWLISDIVGVNPKLGTFGCTLMIAFRGPGRFSDCRFAQLRIYL